MVCLPATVTSAFFVAVILLDLYNREGSRVPGHALLGVFAVLLTSFICERTNEGVAWLLIFFPFILLVLGYLVRLIFSVDYKSYLFGSASTQKQTYNDTYTCPCCHYSPCQCVRPCTPPPPPPPAPSCPGPKPEPVPTCPMPKPPTPACPPKPGTCIKGTL